MSGNKNISIADAATVERVRGERRIEQAQSMVFQHLSKKIYENLANFLLYWYEVVGCLYVYCKRVLCLLISRKRLDKALHNSQRSLPSVQGGF